MPDGSLESGIDIENDTAIRLVDSLPTHFPKALESPNYKIYGSIAEKADHIAHDIDHVQNQSLVTEADSFESLRELSKFVNVVPKSDDSLETLRKRTLATFQNVTSEATIKDIITSAAFILEIDKKHIGYVENPSPGVVRLRLPGEAVDDSPLSTTKIVEILRQNIAAGYRLQVVSVGTLIYITPTERENNDYDPDLTYAGLDSNGNVTDGGTYSTIL